MKEGAERAWVRVDRDPCGHHPSLTCGAKGLLPQTTLIATTAFFVPSATTYASPGPSPPPDIRVSASAASVRAQAAPVSPQYQAKNSDIGVRVLRGADRFSSRGVARGHFDRGDRRAFPLARRGAGGARTDSPTRLHSAPTPDPVSNRLFAVPIIPRDRCLGGYEHRGSATGELQSPAGSIRLYLRPDPMLDRSSNESAQLSGTRDTSERS
jgi:hypothetical protein